MTSSLAPKSGKLRKTSIERIPPPERGAIVVWDTEAKGFGCRCSATGRKVYIVQKRTKAGRMVKLTLGVHGDITTAQARDLALKALGAIADNRDPAEELRKARGEERDRRTAPTVADLASEYLNLYAIPKKSAQAAKQDEQNLNRHILPAIGSRRVPEVTRTDIQRIHVRMKDTQIQANRTLSLLSSMFAFA